MATLQNKMSDCHNIGDLIILLKQSISENLCVSSLAYFNSVVSNNGNYRVLSVKPFPLEYDQTDFNLQVYDFSVDYEYEKNDILLVVYADKNFTSQLGNKIPKNCLENELRHLVSYGIAIPLKNKNICENKEIYDNTERLIGNYFGDNLYKKTFVYNNPITQNTPFQIGKLGNQSEETNDISIKDVIKINFTIRQSDESIIWSNYFNSMSLDNPVPEGISIGVYKNTGIVFGTSYNENWGSPKLIVTVEYTKN